MKTNKKTKRLQIRDLVKFRNSKGELELGEIDFIFMQVGMQVKIFVKANEPAWIKEDQIIDTYKVA